MEMDADVMDRSDSAPAPARDGVRESQRDHNSRRAAACLVCRRSKIKCEKGRALNDDRCHRCLQLGVQCVRPDFHVGRRKGVKKSVSTCIFFVCIGEHGWLLLTPIAASEPAWKRRCIRWSRP